MFIIRKRSKNKYGAVKTGGYDSKKECKRGIQLILLEKNGKISNLKKQVPFVLQDKFKYGKETIRSIKYIADFVYNQNGKIIVEDVKGKKTNVYNLKKKMFLNKYGDKYIFIES